MISEYDLIEFVSLAVETNGMIKHDIDGFNDLIDNGINQIMTYLFEIDRSIDNKRSKTVEDKEIAQFRIQINYHDAQIHYPVFTSYQAGKRVKLLPNESRINGLPYAAPFKLSATVTLTALYKDGRESSVKTCVINDFTVGEMPIMVGSNKCHTKNCSRDAKINMKEDPLDDGGYFIAKTNEITLDKTENIKYNIVHLHKAVRANEFVRAEFLSQPNGAFENSSQVRIRYMINGQITIEITSIKFNKVRIPFYLLYRMLGMLSDREITKTIIYDIDDSRKVTKQLIDILNTAFHLCTDTFEPIKTSLNYADILKTIAMQMIKHVATDAKNSEMQQQYISNMALTALDSVFLPHMGRSSGDRIKKLIFVGTIIRKMLLCHMNIVPPTDRDSFANKRIHGSGVSLAKSLKTHFNDYTSRPVFKAIQAFVGNTPWSEINTANLRSTFLNAINVDFTKAMVTAIVSGKQQIVVDKKVSTNRTSGSLLERKNQLNKISVQRMIITSGGNTSKQTERAILMRGVHASMSGFICPSQSNDTGEAIGMRKQMAVTATICSAENSKPLIINLLSHESVIALENVDLCDMWRNQYSSIYVNGEWIGCCQNARVLANEYRQHRRNGKIISATTTIYWDAVNNEVEFWLDVGRMRRPLIIVYNNLEEILQANSEGKPLPEFRQWTKYTSEIAQAIKRKEITMEDLIRDQVCEYITCEEQINCYLADTLQEFISHQNDICYQYTHLDIPQAMMGFAALTSPYLNRTQPARITMLTNHIRQASGWYALSFPYRVDKNRFFQLFIHQPLITTLTYRFISPAGSTCDLAIMSWQGENQEDSAIVSQGARDRGLFEGYFFQEETCEIISGVETITNPNPTVTRNMQPGANYEKLVNGLIPVGTQIKKDDVIIGKVAHIKASKKTDQIQYIDKSVIYKKSEVGTVVEVLTPRNSKDERSVVVKIVYYRQLIEGDKLSSRSGNKSIVARILPQSDMPFCEDTGKTPDIIVNTHGIPKRMPNGQLVEHLQGIVCAKRGFQADGTGFLPVDIDNIGEDLVKLGFRYNGKQRMYNGVTGEYFNAAMFCGPVNMLRLQKFVIDDKQIAGDNCPTDPRTGQPRGGKGGGTRYGEMELHCLFSHGASQYAYEAVCTDSDGRKTHICRQCGNQGLYNPKLNIYACRHCGENADLTMVDTCKVATLVAEELATANIQITRGIEPRRYMI